MEADLIETDYELQADDDIEKLEEAKKSKSEVGYGLAEYHKVSSSKN